MEDWFSQLEKTLHQAAEDTERWLTATADTLLDSAEQMTEEFESTIDQALDQMDQVVEPWATILTSNLASWVEEVSAPISQIVEPLVQDHPRCVGCRNYHGQTYGGHTLVCALHPYGPDEDLAQCPDWESSWQ
jgi:DNA-binding transcriptional regulator YbjK